MNPFVILNQWIAEERLAGVPFSHGAVLGTVGQDGAPKTRMLGVLVGEECLPRFHTSPGSRKVADIAANQRASVTFAFQRSLRSVSLEGVLELMSREKLLSDWETLEPKFRRSYLVFGSRSGELLEFGTQLEELLSEISCGAENDMPASFVGYQFKKVDRISLYSVGTGDFAEHVVFSKGKSDEGWTFTRVVP